MAERTRSLRTVLAAGIALPVVLVLLFASHDDRGLRGDEGFYGLVVAEMTGSGDWGHLVLEGAPFRNKPPLAFWAMGTSVRLFGLSEPALRYPGAFASLLLAGWVFAVGRRRAGPAAGAVAAILLVAAPHALHFHGWRSAVTEPWLALWTLGSLLVIAHAGDRRRSLWLLGLLTCLNALTKGLVGPTLVALTTLAAAGLLRLWRIEPRDGAPRTSLLRSPALTTAVVLGPAVVVYFGWWLWNDPSFEHLGWFLSRDWLARAAGTLQPSHLRPWSYLPRRVLGDYGWWLLAAALAYRPSEIRRLLGTRDDEGLLLRLLGPLVVLAFSIPASKIAWYVYPAYPAISLVVVEGISQLSWSRKGRSYAHASIWAVALALALVNAARSYRTLPPTAPNSLARLARIVESLEAPTVLVDSRLQERSNRPREWNRFTLYGRLAAEEWSPGESLDSERCLFLVTGDPELAARLPSSVVVPIARQARSKPEPPLFVIDSCDGAFARTLPDRILESEAPADE